MNLHTVTLYCGIICVTVINIVNSQGGAKLDSHSQYCTIIINNNSLCIRWPGPGMGPSTLGEACPIEVPLETP